MKFNIDAGPAPGMTAAATQQAVRNAYQTWTSVSCAAFSVQDLGVVTQPKPNIMDQINTHVWPSAWASWNDPDAYAATWVRVNSPTASIVDADTEYNPSWKWSDAGGPGTVDARSVATHEIGHQLGLDHSDVVPSTMCATMGDGDTYPRSLDADDIAGVCHLYPNGKPLPPECTGPGQCAPDETCQSNTCVMVGQKGYGGPCTEDKDCISWVCVDFGTGSLCTVSCDTTPCPDADDCVELEPGAEIGKACEPSTGTPGRALGAPCSVNAECKSQLCVPVPDKGMLCAQPCDPQKGDCPPTFHCATTAGGGLCYPGQSSPPTKQAFGGSCAKNEDCLSGICSVDPAGKPFCTKVCTAAEGCPSGFACLTAGELGTTCARTGATGEGGVARDGGLTRDGGATASPSGSEGCACCVTQGPAPGALVLLVLPLFVLLRRRRSRAALERL
jgi:MYXO-CTERM domain-containing protein